VTYVIAAAGTGGHVNPALSVAEALVERGVSRRDVLFLGGSRFESRTVPDAGFRFVGFELTHLRRSLSAENLRIPSVLRRTSAAMSREMRDADAGVVLGMSGYVTVPAAMAARRASVPFVLQEQNAVAGLAARFAARRAVRTFLGLPGQAQRLPRSVLIGNPLRPEFEAFDRQALRPQARRRYGIERAERVVGILGGSQGARVLNQAADGIARHSGAGAIVHLTGLDAAAEMQQVAAGSSLPWICVPYEAEMQHFFAAVDVVVCRAGAMTVSELAATGTPSVLVPLRRVGQRGNAEILADMGAGVVVDEPEIGMVPDRVGALLADEHRRAAMARSVRELHRADAGAAIADSLIEVAHG